MLLHLYMYVYTSISMSVCMHACLYMRMHAYMYMYMYHEHATSSHIRMRLRMISERLWPKPRPSPPFKNKLRGVFFWTKTKIKNERFVYTRREYGGLRRFLFLHCSSKTRFSYIRNAHFWVCVLASQKTSVLREGRGTEFFFSKVCKGYQKMKPPFFFLRSGYYNNR